MLFKPLSDEENILIFSIKYENKIILYNKLLINIIVIDYFVHNRHCSVLILHLKNCLSMVAIIDILTIKNNNLRFRCFRNT